MRPVRWRHRRRSRRSARRSGSTVRARAARALFRDIAAGDLGRSLVTGQPSAVTCVERFPASFELTFVAMTLALIVSIPLGIVAAIRAGSWIDHLVAVHRHARGFDARFRCRYRADLRAVLSSSVSRRSRSTASIPSCSSRPTVTGLMLLDSLIAGDCKAFLSAAGRLILPALTMAVIVIAPLMRMTRASMIAVLASDFIRTARAAGMGCVDCLCALCLAQRVVAGAHDRRSGRFLSARRQCRRRKGLRVARASGHMR